MLSPASARLPISMPVLRALLKNPEPPPGAAPGAPGGGGGASVPSLGLVARVSLVTLVVFQRNLPASA